MNRLALLTFAVFFLVPAVLHAETLERKIIIKDHVFVPATTVLPSGKKAKLVIENQDDSAEEFDSHALKREKIIPPRSQGAILVGPLSPGTYKFEGEFHAATAQGVITVE